MRIIIRNLPQLIVMIFVVACVDDSKYQLAPQEIGQIKIGVLESNNSVDTSSTLVNGGRTEVLANPAECIGPNYATCRLSTDKELVFNNSQVKIVWSIVPPIDWVSSLCKLELYKGGSYLMTIASEVASSPDYSGFYDWHIPSLPAYGTDFRIKISSVANPNYYSFGNEFAIFYDWASSYGYSSAPASTGACYVSFNPCEEEGKPWDDHTILLYGVLDNSTSGHEIYYYTPGTTTGYFNNWTRLNNVGSASSTLFSANYGVTYQFLFIAKNSFGRSLTNGTYIEYYHSPRSCD